MIVDVELLSRDAALVIAKPSWWRRFLFGDRIGPAVAIRGPVVDGIQLWRYEDSQRLCSAAVASAIDEAVFMRSLIKRLRTSLEPPS